MVFSSDSIKSKLENIDTTNRFNLRKYELELRTANKSDFTCYDVL